MEPIILMEKDNETGFLVKEIDTYILNVEEEIVDKIYMVKENEKNIVNLQIKTDKEVEDWEFSAVFDYYNEEVLKDKVISFEEVEECYNPTWKVTLEFIDQHESMEELLNEILDIHVNELARVYEEVADKKKNTYKQYKNTLDREMALIRCI